MPCPYVTDEHVFLELRDNVANEFVPTRLADYSNESLIAEIRRVAAILPANEPLTVSAFLRHSRVHCSTYQRRFGSWKKALQAAGLEKRFDSSNKPVTEPEAIAELQRISAALGRKAITKRDLLSYGSICPDVFCRRFGSWRKALERAGLESAKLGRRYTDEECFENLLRVWTHYGRQPQHDEMKVQPSTVGPKAYVLRWGTWMKAIYAFVERVNQEPSVPAAQPAKVVESSVVDKTPGKPEDRRDIPLGLRYKVLLRDRFRCVLCGASPSENLTCDLHVDHIVAFSKGGKTTIENLRTTCEACNLGKGNRTETTGPSS